MQFRSNSLRRITFLCLKLKVNVDSETDAEKLKVALKIGQFAIKSQLDQFDLIEKDYKDEINSFRKKIAVNFF